MLNNIFAFLTLVYYILVLGVAVGVVLDNRNPAKTLAYLLLLLFVPFFGLVVYVLFGQNLRKQKLFSRKGIIDNERVKKWNALRLLQFNETSEVTQEFSGGKIKVANLLLKTDDAPISKNNALHVMHDSHEIFAAMFADMRQAKHHLHIEFYILEDDEVGREFQQILMEKAKAGIEVRLSIDDVGSRSLPNKYLKELKAAGVEVAKFMPVIFPFLTSRANFRNHRKIVVIDGEVGYIGGINIADRYTNRKKKNTFWRDTQLRMRGQCVKSLQLQFILNWRFVAKKSIEINDLYFPLSTETTEHLVQISATGPDSDWPGIMHAIIMAISTAEKYVYISTPYFIPSEEVLAALQIAALSGIDVQILLPKRGDSLLTQSASMSFVRQMLEAGVKVHRYSKGFIHAKTMVVDDVLSTIGTTNMDYRSFTLNFEINAFCYNNEIALGLRKQFEIDKETSEEIALERWERRPRTKRVIESVARMFAPLL